MNQSTTNPEPQLLIVDAMSGGNDFAVSLISKIVAARLFTTVFTVENTRLRSTAGVCLLAYWPKFGGGISIRTIAHMLSATARLWFEILRHRHGCIHIQFSRFFIVELVLLGLSRPWLSRVVVTMHNATPHERNRLQEALLPVWCRLADQIIVLSESVRDEICARYAVAPSKFSVIPHGNYDDFAIATQRSVSSEELSKIVDKVAGSTVIAMAGLIREYKGVDTLVQSTVYLDKFEKWSIVIAGGGAPSLIASYSDTARKLGMHDRVHIIGHFLSDTDLAVLLRRADILVYPYRNVSQSGALLLGMTFGRACICSDHPGFREYLRDAECIYFSPADDPRALALHIARLVTDSALRQSLGTAARLAAANRFGWPDIVTRHLASYAGAGGYATSAARDASR